MSTARPTQRDRQFVEIRRISSRPAPTPTADDLTLQLALVPQRPDPTIALLLVSSVVFLVVGMAAASIIAWVAGVVSLATAFSVDTRHERELRDVRLLRERNHLRRRHRIGGVQAAGPVPTRARVEASGDWVATPSSSH